MSSPFRVALLRAIATAVFVGVSTFFALWASSSIGSLGDALGDKAIVIGTVTPVLTVLGARFVGEGWIDTNGAK